MQEVDQNIIVHCNGKDIEFDARAVSGYDTTSTDKLVIKEIFYENVYEVYESDFDDTGIVVDIGGNIGAFDLYCACLGAKQIFSFEPDSNNYPLLVNNIKQNGFSDKIIPLNYGIYKTDGEQQLLNGQGASFIIGNKTPTTEAQNAIDAGNTPAETIKTMPLAKALHQLGITYADVLKVDCEGSEYAIIASTPSDVINKFRYITMEFHVNTASSFGAMVAKIGLTHNTRFFGSYKTGGQLYAKRY